MGFAPFPQVQSTSRSLSQNANGAEKNRYHLWSVCVFQGVETTIVEYFQCAIAFMYSSKLANKLCSLEVTLWIFFCF